MTTTNNFNKTEFDVVTTYGRLEEIGATLKELNTARWQGVEGWEAAITAVKNYLGERASLLTLQSEHHE